MSYNPIFDQGWLSSTKCKGEKTWSLTRVSFYRVNTKGEINKTPHSGKEELCLAQRLWRHLPPYGSASGTENKQPRCLLLQATIPLLTLSPLNRTLLLLFVKTVRVHAYQALPVRWAPNSPLPLQYFSTPPQRTCDRVVDVTAHLLTGKGRLLAGVTQLVGVSDSQSFCLYRYHIQPLQKGLKDNEGNISIRVIFPQSIFSKAPIVFDDPIRKQMIILLMDHVWDHKCLLWINIS